MMGLATLTTACGGFTRSTAGRWSLVGGMRLPFRVRPRGMIPHLPDPTTRRGNRGVPRSRKVRKMRKTTLLLASMPLAVLLSCTTVALMAAQGVADPGTGV